MYPIVEYAHLIGKNTADFTLKDFLADDVFMFRFLFSPCARIAGQMTDTP